MMISSSINEVIFLRIIHGDYFLVIATEIVFC